MTHEFKHPNYYKRLKELQKNEEVVPQEQDQEEHQKEETQDKKED